MKIAIHNPFFLQYDQYKNYNGYDFKFFIKYKPIIYLSKEKYYKGFCENIKLNNLNYEEFDIVTSIDELNSKADVLMCFNGRPDTEWNCPPKKFEGLKIYHVMDYVFKATESNSNLVNNGVDYLMGYNDHSKYCDFFKKFYTRYTGKVIGVPFGFGERFNLNNDFNKRIQKVVGLGSVNPVRDPLVTAGELEDYIKFYGNKIWTHEWRRALCENKDSLTNLLESYYPEYPKTKDFEYDAVKLLGSYAMFANDEGIMNFPPARTYEGVAAGSVMISSNNEIYKELGFVDGENCILHRKNDLDDFKQKVEFYLEHIDTLEKISIAGQKMMKENYSHDRISEQLYNKVSELFNN